MVCCCFRKYRADPPPNFFVTRIMATTPKRIRRVSQPQYQIMMERTVRRMVPERTIWGRAWETSCLSVSMSFV